MSYRLSGSLGLDDLATAISARGSELRRFHHLAVRVNSGDISHWEAFRRMRTYRRYDLAEVARFMNDFAARLATRVAFYHPDPAPRGSAGVAVKSTSHASASAGWFSDQAVVPLDTTHSDDQSDDANRLGWRLNPATAK